MSNIWDAIDERKTVFEEARVKWFRWFVGNIVVLFVLAILMFAGIFNGMNLTLASWLVFVIALPLVYSAIFFQSQHAKARDYLEEYAFKSLVAHSLPEYRDFLKKDIDAGKTEEKKKYLDFAVATIKDIYVPPREIISKHPLKAEEGTVPVGVVEKLGDVFKKFIP